MSTSLVSNLPAPPRGKTGWPWVEETFPASEVLSNDRPWPRISVITPSYNQGQFIEQTIRSVLRQGYPDLEYIVIDGHSSDDSAEVIKKYGSHLAYWTSEPDHGQSHAINKGLAKATGQIMCWLNSDDYYLPGALRVVGELLADGTGVFAAVGDCYITYTDGRPPYEAKGRYESRRRLLEYWKGYQMHQPSIFWRREVFDKVGFLDESQRYIMDFDYWARIAEHFEFKNINRFLSCATYHPSAKTGDNYEQYFRALKEQSPRYWGSPFRANYWSLRLSMFRHLTYHPLRNRTKNAAYSYLSRTKRLFR